MPEFESMMVDDEDFHYSLSLRSKTAKQHRSWLLRRAPVAAGSLLYFLSLRDKPPQCFCFGNFDQALVSHGSARKPASPLSFHPERSEGSLRSSRKFIVKITVTSRRCMPRTSSIERRHVELDHPLAIGFPRCTRDKENQQLLKKPSSPANPSLSSPQAGRSPASPAQWVRCPAMIRQDATKTVPHPH